MLRDMCYVMHAMCYMKNMDTLECIKTRRSRRLFTDKPVADEQLNEIIGAALHAPSSRNCQPWQFVVVRDDKVKRELAGLKSENNQQHILSASVVIVICSDTDKSPSSWCEDGVCAAMNILLAAHELGLGAVYVSGFSRTDEAITAGIRKVLDLPQNIMPIVIIPLGYADKDEDIEEKALPDPGKVIHLDKY